MKQQFMNWINLRQKKRQLNNYTYFETKTVVNFKSDL